MDRSKSIPNMIRTLLYIDVHNISPLQCRIIAQKTKNQRENLKRLATRKRKQDDGGKHTWESSGERESCHGNQFILSVASSVEVICFVFELQILDRRCKAMFAGCCNIDEKFELFWFT